MQTVLRGERKRASQEDRAADLRSPQPCPAPAACPRQCTRARASRSAPTRCRTPPPSRKTRPIMAPLAEQTTQPSAETVSLPVCKRFRPRKRCPCPCASLPAAGFAHARGQHAQDLSPLRRSRNLHPTLGVRRVTFPF
eukprot:3489492-Rhodomonas_salina.1